MLFLLRELAARGELVLAGLAHLHHHIRGADADADAAFCRELAARLEIAGGDRRCRCARLRRNAMACRSRSRAARRGSVSTREALTTVDAARVAVAHTRDDQAETVLLAVDAGSRHGGSCRHGAASRPGGASRCSTPRAASFSSTSRDRGESWREDATNLDRSIPRNRVRHDVMPHLRTINAQADAALARAADMLRVDADFLETLANAKYLQIVETDTEQDRVIVSAAELTRLAGGAGYARGAVCARNRESVPLVWLRRGSSIVCVCRGWRRRRPCGPRDGTFWPPKLS